MFLVVLINEVKLGTKLENLDPVELALFIGWDLLGCPLTDNVSIFRENFFSLLLLLIKIIIIIIIIGIDI